MRVMDTGAGCDGVFAEKAEIKVYGVFLYAGVIADDEMNADYFSCVDFPGVIE